MAAGLGFKDFVTGEVLTAADVDGYLMQGIWVFASTAARDAAVTSPQEGNFAFTKDTNSLWYYDGAAWVASGATGDIEGVTAGIGISGGGTSGTVTVTNSMATAIDAKGDLVVGTGADTFSKLTVGANNTVLTADSAQATGLKWATPASGAGMTFIDEETFSAVSSVSFNNVFTSTYRNYYVVADFVGSANDGCRVRLRVSGSDNSDGNYYNQRFNAEGSGVNAVRGSGNDKWNVMDTTTGGSGGFLVFFNPQTSDKSALVMLGYSGGTTPTLSGNGNFKDSTTSFDGFILFPSAGTITGQIRVYGLANS